MLFTVAEKWKLPNEEPNAVNEGATSVNEESQSTSLAHLQTIYSETPIGLCFNDCEMRYAQVNTQLALINDLPVEEHIGKTPAEVLPAELGAAVEAQLRQVLQSGEQVSNLELRAVSPSNPAIKRDWLVSYHPVKRDNGEMFGVSTAVQDITALKLTERRHDTAGAIARLLVGDMDFQDTVVAVLHRFIEHLGVSRAEYWEEVVEEGGLHGGQRGRLRRVSEVVSTVAPGAVLDAGELAPESNARPSHRGNAFGSSVQHAHDGLIGPAWSRNTVSWITDVSTASHFSRADEARRLGLLSGMAFPIVNTGTGQVNGVICLFLDECLPRTEVHAQMLETVGLDLGEYRRRLFAERAARRAQVEYKLLTDNIPDIVARFDRRYRYLYVNPAISHLTGHAPDEVIGRSNRELGMPEAFCDHWNSLVERVFLTDAEVHDEFDFLTPDGTRSFRVRLIPEHRDDASTSSVLGVTTDITEHRKIQSSLAEREATLKSALHELDSLYATAPVGLCVLDNDMRILKINETLARVHGKTPAQLTGQRGPEVNRQVAEQLDPLIKQVFATGQAMLDQEISLGVAVEGESSPELMHWRASYIPLGWQDGKPVTVSCTVVDVTQQKRSEQALQLALQKADAANRSKSEFLANMSHEIRSPLTAILGHVEILNDRLDDDADRRDLTTIGANGQHLLSLLNDFLDLAKIESGVIDVQNQAVSLESLVNAVFSLLAGRGSGEATRVRDSLPDAAARNHRHRCGALAARYSSTCCRMPSSSPIRAMCDLRSTQNRWMPPSACTTSASPSPTQAWAFPLNCIADCSNRSSKPTHRYQGAIREAGSGLPLAVGWHAGSTVISVSTVPWGLAALSR